MVGISDKDVIKGIWEFGKHQKQIELEEQKLQQRQKELEEFARSGGKQTELFEKQLRILEQQVDIQHTQTKILQKTYWIYVVLAIIAVLNVLILIFRK